MKIIDVKLEKQVVHPKTIIISEEVEKDKKLFEEKLRLLKKSKKFFLSSSKVPTKNVSQFIGNKFNENVSLKKDCKCSRVFSNGSHVGKKACVCEWTLDCEFVKFKGSYGYLFEKIVIDTKANYGGRVWDELG